MIRKIKKKIKENGTIFLTLLISLGIVITIYILKEVVPFGEKTLLQIDFFHQYAPMLSGLADKIKKGKNLIYDFNTGFGLPFTRNFTNYLGSVFNIIILFFNKKNVLTSFSIIIGLKAALSATTMVYFLSKKFNTKNKLLIPLSLLYAFSAYMHAYYWNLMWLDSMVYLPIIILGIENIINKDKSLLYIIFLALALLSNYFTAYMVCLFSVIYFITYLFIKTEKFNLKSIGKKIFKFAYSSLLAGGITAIMLLPQFIALQSTSATGDLWPTSQYYAFTFWEYFGNHFTGVGPTIFASDFTNAANISVGVLPIALLLLFIINPNIKLKTKIGYVFIIVFFAIGFFYAPLDFIWHAFHVPNDLPYRYTFLYAFVMIVISSYAILNIQKEKLINVSIIFIFTSSLVLLLHIFKFENINQKMIILNIIILSVSYILYLIPKFNKKTIKFIPYILMILICTEILLVANQNWDVTQIKDNFYYRFDEVQDTVNFITDVDEDMVRFEKTWILTYNDPIWYDYYGQGIFSSVGYESMARLNVNLGMPGNHINSYFYKDNTPIYDLLFNIRYYMGDYRDDKRYELFYNINDNITYKTKFDTNLMYVVNSDIRNWEHITVDPFYIQNDFLKTTTGVENVLKFVNILKEEVIYHENDKTISKVTIENPGDTVYLYSSSADFVIVDNTVYHDNNDYEHIFDIDGLDIYNFESIEEKYVIPKNSEEKSFDIYIGKNYQTCENLVFVYYIDNEKFFEAVEKINENKVNITSFKESNIEANVNSNKNGTLFTSIPYDKGWKVYVNNKQVKTYKIADSLLAFNIAEGNNDIKLKFLPNGLHESVLISIGSVIIVFILYKKRKI